MRQSVGQLPIRLGHPPGVVLRGDGRIMAGSDRDLRQRETEFLAVGVHEAAKALELQMIETDTLADATEELRDRVRVPRVIAGRGEGEHVRVLIKPGTS